MLDHNVKRLKKIVKRASAEDAAWIMLILKSIHENRPDDILKELQRRDELYKYYEIYKKYSTLKIDQLKENLSKNMLKMPAISLLIIMHILNSLQTSSSVQWKEPLSKESFDYYKTSLFSEIEKKARDEIIDYISSWKIDAKIPLVSVWASEDRYLPAGTTEYPGKVDHSIAPHLVEIQDRAHPDDETRTVTIMKGDQALVTTLAESAMGLAIKYGLHDILYITSTKGIGRIRSSSAIDVMIDYSGLADCLKPMSNRRNQKMADNTYYKELKGNRRFMVTSYNSIADAKSLKWTFIIMDELIEAPFELKDQGDPEMIFQGRGRTARGLKIFKMSTPKNTTDRIYTNFKNGDQRYYFCQCPKCGEKQVLELLSQGRTWGLCGRSETINNIERIIPETVAYKCKFCEEKIPEEFKGFMLQNGVWRPTATPKNPDDKSYHVSNLMSPVVFYSWRQAMQEFCETDFGQNITKLKSFIINVLGEPWESRTEKMKWTDLKQRAEDYKLEDIPKGGLIITAGVDVHPHRLELISVAWGKDLEKWIIDYKIFHGDTSIKNQGPWKELRTFIMTKTYVLRTKNIPLSMVAIDTGYRPKAQDEDDIGDWNKEHVVYEFVASMMSKCVACRGNDKLNDVILKQEKVKRKSALKIRYDTAVSLIKDETFQLIDMPAGSPGAFHFSKYLPDEFFKGFVSEVYRELAPGKWGWSKTYERNEPLDTYILARVAAEYLNLQNWNDFAWEEYEKTLFS